MFKKNTKHLQPALISSINQLPKKQLEILQGSWAGTFYEEIFCRIDEDIFSVLYSSKPSRPNVPVNVLAALEILKAGHGWSDEELMEHFMFNLQVRYALGYDQLGDGDFAIRTLYYFRERLSKYHLETGKNLFSEMFKSVTGTQIETLGINTEEQRMDSVQIASNIIDGSRLRLLVEAIQRTHRMLSKEDQERMEELYAPYLKGSSDHYTYRIKGKAAKAEHLQKVGIAIFKLLAKLEENYAEEKAYQVLKRIFSEHFIPEENDVRPKESKELSSGSLQSVDDLEASFRTKRGKHYKGFVANVSETCSPENDVQLITNIQVEPNNVDDDQMLADALPDLIERTDLNKLRVDGGYGGEDSDEVLSEHSDVEIIQTAIRGAKPDPDKFHLADFDVVQDEQGEPTKITCPHGATVNVKIARTTGRQARFDPEICAACPYQKDGTCKTKPQKRDPRYLLSFTLKELQAAKRRKTYLEHKDDRENPRAAVEATVRSVKHPFRAGKLPVRGQFRVTSMLIASALHVNMRRIWKHNFVSLFFWAKIHFVRFFRTEFQVLA
jgi:hypothetical protein